VILCLHSAKQQITNNNEFHTIRFYRVNRGSLIFHSGTLPGVHGAPAASSCFSNRADRLRSVAATVPAHFEILRRSIVLSILRLRRREIDMRCAPTRNRRDR
jgi:hypothetical protein